MWHTLPAILLLAYLPGAVLYRLPIGQPHLRASRPAEERVFWSIVLSFALSSTIGLTLASAGAYSLTRLLWVDGIICIVLVAVLRGHLRFPTTAPLPGPSAAIPAGLVAVVVLVTLHVQPAEYVIGGKDPGTYMNEGIQIAQQGALIVRDEVIASLPPDSLELFVQPLERDTYYGSRFMGFYLRNADDGAVVGQFPHLYPFWIAVGYAIDGLPGARAVIGWLALFGVVSVYFTGAWLIGKPAAAAGALLLAINVAQVWYGRYPNAEILTQGLVFSGVLAFSRASADDDGGFALLAAWLLSLSCFTHLTGFIAAGTMGAASLLTIFDRRKLPLAFLTPLAVGMALAAYYMATVLTPYIEDYENFFLTRPFILPSLMALASGYVLFLSLARTRAAAAIRSSLPWIVLAGLWLLAGYAYFVREPTGRLAPHDAYALRHFAEYYLSPIGLLAALLGLTLLTGRTFWRSVGLISVLAAFAVIFFYKIRVIPEHFWAARRFLAIVLPAACLLIGAVAFPTVARMPRWIERAVPTTVRVALGVALITFIGVGYVRATLPIVNHVEYAGVTAELDAIDAQITDADLVLVESRQASDLHTLALPLAYVYGRDVLIFVRREPQHELFHDFLRWAKARYDRVLYFGGNATPVLSQLTDVTLIGGHQFFVPQYESAYHAYPTEVRLKQYDALLFDVRPLLVPPERFEVDLGADDDAFVQGFFPKETLGGSDITFRWTSERSFVSLLGVGPEHRMLTVWLNEGGRATDSPTPQVQILLNEELLGAVSPTPGFQPYQFEIPLDLADALAEDGTAGRLTIQSTTWTPSESIGGNDDRALGVMVDRLTVE